MNELARKNLIATIIEKEALRPLSRLDRLKRAPCTTLPYYILAALSHLKPFKITFATLWNTKMTCYLPEGNTFYYYGYCEANLTNFFIRYIKPGMNVVDVGAHVGIYSMLASELVLETGRVISFEPTPWTYRLLEQNTKQLKNVTILNNAVSNRAEELVFSDYGPGYGAYNSAHSAGAADLHKTAHHIPVLSVTLDSIAEQHNLHPDLIKIDAEGFEHEVLTGGHTLLTNTFRTRPLVSIEVAGGESWTENRSQSFAFLAECHYVPYEISTEGFLTPHTLQDSYTYDNLLFVPEERITDIKPFCV